MTAPATAPIEVARRANELFSSVPFEQLSYAVHPTRELALATIDGGGGGAS